MHYSSPYMGHMGMGGGNNSGGMNMHMHMNMNMNMNMMMSMDNNFSQVHPPPPMESPQPHHQHNYHHNNNNNHHQHHHQQQHQHFGGNNNNSNSSSNGSNFNSSPNPFLVQNGGHGCHSINSHHNQSQGQGHHFSSTHNTNSNSNSSSSSNTNTNTNMNTNFGSGQSQGQDDSVWPWRCGKNSCPNFASIFCPRCESVAYCCEPHRQEEEINHKGDCTPETNFTFLYHGSSSCSSASSISSSTSDFNNSYNNNKNNSSSSISINNCSSSYNNLNLNSNSNSNSSSMEKIFISNHPHAASSSSSSSSSASSSSCFSFLSTNNLSPGDTVCRIRPKMMIPHDKDLPGPVNSSLCLGCCKWFPSNSYKCSKCSWPVCSYHCENNSLHASYECNIFLACNVPVIYFPGIYDALLALRCISLFNYDPGFWKAFQNWNAFIDHHQVQQQQQQPYQRPASAPPLDSILVTPSVSVHSNLNINVDAITIKFLLKDCRLGSEYYTPDALRNVLHFLSQNSLCQENQVSVYDVQDTRSYHSAKYVFPYKYVYGQHCNPNVNWTINYGPTLKEAYLHIWATQNVKIGDKLTACFSISFPEFGTLERRTLQRLHDQPPCRCERCSDPTELGSYCSAISCDECDNGESGDGGYLLSVNPLSEKNERWKCTNKACGRIVESEFVCSKFYHISKEICDVKDDLSGLLNIIKKLKVVLHPQHYLIAQAANYIVEMGWNHVRNRLINSFTTFDFLPYLKAGQICLNFADKVSPGLTSHRAKYIYFLQMMGGISEVQNALYYHQNNMLVEGRLIRENFDIIHLYQKHCQKILLRKKMGSREYEWMQPLAPSIDDLAELLRVTVRQRAFDTYSLERLQKAFAYFCAEEYQPNLPSELQVDLSPVLTDRELKPTRLEYKTFFGF